MLDQSQLRQLLDRQARVFEAARQESDQPGTCGWGQFLDPPTRAKQIGIYGTAAGVIVLSLAGRGPTALDIVSGTNLIQGWWAEHSHDTYAAQRLAQNGRLALLCLALRLADVEGTQATLREVEEELLSRILPSQMWGHYWVSSGEHDSSPRTVPTSLAVIALTIFRSQANGTGSAIQAKIAPVIDKLEAELVAIRRSPLESAFAITAILCARPNVTTTVRRRMVRTFRAIQSSGYDLYFDIFEYAWRSSAGPLAWGRDYFIAPVTLISALAGLQEGAPVTMRLHSEIVLRDLARRIEEDEGRYRKSLTERAASLDQIWSSALFWQATIAPRRFSPRAGRTWYCLLKRRRDNWFTRTVMPAGAPIVAVVFTVFASLDEGSSLTARIIGAVAILVLTKMYPGDIFKIKRAGQ